MSRPLGNLLADLPDASVAEVFEDLCGRDGVRIERIVSHGQATPVDHAYDQPHHEWVLVLAGAAGLWLEPEGERILRPGDQVFIPARTRHRVTWTAPDAPTIWLAVHWDARED
ncbi:MAG: cupin domain-containing protein [Alsobacter sp.]